MRLKLERGTIMNISEQIKVLCVRSNISVSELARRVGTSPQNFNAKLKRESFTISDLEQKQINPDLIIMNGFDETMVAGLALGASGSIGSTFNFMYPHYKKIYNLYRGKKLDEALELQIKANNIMYALCGMGLIPAIKYILSTMGIDASTPRKPFTPLSEEQKTQIDLVLRDNLIV